MKTLDTCLIFAVGVGGSLILNFLLQSSFYKRIIAGEAASSGTLCLDARDSCSSSFPSSGSDFEVFLSFRGEDVRSNFARHLYNALVKGGIRTFKDDEEIEIGEKIDPALRSAIHRSKIAIPILSKDYASSNWCLGELAESMERRVQGQITVMPIFYHVDPSEVQNQEGCFQTPFQNHDKVLDQNTVQRWRKALQDVSKLKGWRTAADWHEGKLIEAIVETVRRKLINGPTPKLFLTS